MPYRAPTAEQCGYFAAGTPSTRGKITTATKLVTVQRRSGAARMPFLAAKDEPPPTHGRRGVGKGRRHALPNRLRPVLTRPFQCLPAPWPTSPRRAPSTVYYGHYTAAMGMVFTHGVEMPETSGRRNKRDNKTVKAAGHLNVRMLTSGSVHVSLTEQVRVLE